MTRNRLAFKRARYYHLIYVYKQRREKLRNKFRYKWGQRNVNPGYNKSVVNLNNKIAYWNKRIAEIDKTSERIKKLNLAILKFTGHNLRLNKKRCFGSVKVAKGIYYKYGLENGMQPLHLRQYINDKREAHPTEYRTWLTRSFKNDPIKKEAYHNFKKYFEN